MLHFKDVKFSICLVRRCKTVVLRTYFARPADPSSGFPGGLHLPGGGQSGFHLREHHSESGVGGRER